MEAGPGPWGQDLGTEVSAMTTPHPRDRGCVEVENVLRGLVCLRPGIWGLTDLDSNPESGTISEPRFPHL